MSTENIQSPVSYVSEEKREEIIEQLISQEFTPKPLLRLKHISHLDLDGFGATILSEILRDYYPPDAMVLDAVNILPNRLATELEETLNHSDDYDLIVITDLAMNPTVVDMIKNHPANSKVKVFDHHICEIEDLPENIVVTKKSPIHEGKLTCATELYFNFIKNDKVWGLIRTEGAREAIAYFVECIRVYDTFEFWPSRNDPSSEVYINYDDAPRLNILFHIMDREEFKQFIYSKIESFEEYTFTKSTEKYPWVSKILTLEKNKNDKYIESALRRMVKTPFSFSMYRNGSVYNLDYTAGVIFAEKSSPVIANTALERVEDIDFCAVVSNNQVSIYTNRKDIDVSSIAKIFGGGGHEEAAGFTIPYINSAILNMKHFNNIIECAGSLEPGSVTFGDIDVSGIN